MVDTVLHGLARIVDELGPENLLVDVAVRLKFAPCADMVQSSHHPCCAALCAHSQDHVVWAFPFVIDGKDFLVKISDKSNGQSISAEKKRKRANIRGNFASRYRI